MELASPADVRLAHHAILPTKAVFSLNFSSAAKGPFIATIHSHQDNVHFTGGGRVVLG